MDCDDQQNNFDNGLHQDNDIPESFEAGEKQKGDNDDDEGATSEKPASRIHKCEFRSTKYCFNKALGGHKRFNLQGLRKGKEAEPNNNNTNKKKKANCNSKIKPSSDGKQRCTLCNRDFPSNKSLCGHMRFHPEREWRGVHPPLLPSNNNRCSSSPNSNSFEDNNDGDDLRVDAAQNKPVASNVSKYLQPSWHKTDKRGRQQRTYSNEVVNAAQILMLMSRDNWSSSLSGDGKDTFSGEVSANVDNEKEVLPSASGVQDGDEKTVMVKKDNNKRVKIVVRLKNPYSASKYQCSFYGKSFSKFQAYGGHISSHYREKNNNRAPETAESSQSAGSTTIRDFDLNEQPSDVPDETT